MKLWNDELRLRHTAAQAIQKGAQAIQQGVYLILCIMQVCNNARRSARAACVYKKQMYPVKKIKEKGVKNAKIKRKTTKNRTVFSFVTQFQLWCRMTTSAFVPISRMRCLSSMQHVRATTRKGQRCCVGVSACTKTKGKRTTYLKKQICGSRRQVSILVDGRRKILF